jgi:hypothetical protein
MTSPVVAVAGHGLPRVTAPMPNWLRDCAWEPLVADCRTHQVLTLLADAVAEGARQVDDAEREVLQQAVAAELLASVALERDLLAVADVLEHERVPYRVLKGAANAHLDYPDPAWRLFGDIDVAVPGGHLELAKAALEARGFQRLAAERRAGFDARFEKSILLLVPSTAHELDLHRSLISGPFGHHADPNEMFDTVEHFTLGGRTLPALGREERFVHACVTATVSDPRPRIRPARDVVQQLVHPALHPDRALAVAHRWGMGVLVARALTHALDTLAVDVENPLASWARTYRPSRAEQRRLRCYVGVGSSYVRRVVGSLRELPDARARAGYALAMVRPERDAVATPLSDRVRRAAMTATGRFAL